MGKELSSIVTVENAVKTVMLLAAVAVAWAKLNATVDAVEGRTQQLTTEIRQLRSDHEQTTIQVRENAIVNANQNGQIVSLQQGRDADRVLLMDISSKIAVLLDRTDPKTPPPKGASQ